jgi:translation initiation factor 1
VQSAAISMKKNTPANSPYAYSTDTNRPSWNDEPESASTTLAPAQQDLRVTLNKRLKGGKKATIIYQFVGTETDFETLGKHLKNKCGVGGSVKDGEIILQGDCLEKVGKELKELGYRFKFAGI